jgi:hypothetical protein
MSCSQKQANKESDYIAFLDLLNENKLQYEEAEVEEDSFYLFQENPFKWG